MLALVARVGDTAAVPLQPMITGARYMISAGHYLATEAGHAILQAGGNAIDAGVAAGLALAVVHSDQVQFPGVAPILVYLAEQDDHVVFGMPIQEAVEAPRFVTRSFPGSFEPHPCHPGRLDLERATGVATGERLAELGHRVEWLPDLSIGTVCAIVADRQTRILYGGADPRRAARAMGW